MVGVLVSMNEARKLSMACNNACKEGRGLKERDGEGFVDVSWSMSFGLAWVLYIYTGTWRRLRHPVMGAMIEDSIRHMWREIQECYMPQY